MKYKWYMYMHQLTVLGWIDLVKTSEQISNNHTSVTVGIGVVVSPLWTYTTGRDSENKMSHA